jgi:hypothetical protein
MALVVKNSTSQMSDADLRAMAVDLKDLPANLTLRTGKAAPEPTRAAAATLYMVHCGGPASMPAGVACPACSRPWRATAWSWQRTRRTS